MLLRTISALAISFTIAAASAQPIAIEWSDRVCIYADTEIAVEKAGLMDVVVIDEVKREEAELDSASRRNVIIDPRTARGQAELHRMASEGKRRRPWESSETLFAITLRVQPGENRAVRLESWRTGGAKLTDNFGNEYKLLKYDGDFTIRGHTERHARALHDKPVRDVLFFDAPIQAAEYLNLELHASKIGGDYRDRIRIRIPGEMFHPPPPPPPLPEWKWPETVDSSEDAITVRLGELKRLCDEGILHKMPSRHGPIAVVRVTSAFRDLGLNEQNHALQHVYFQYFDGGNDQEQVRVILGSTSEVLGTFSKPNGGFKRSR